MCSNKNTAAYGLKHNLIDKLYLELLTEIALVENYFQFTYYVYNLYFPLDEIWSSEKCRKIFKSLAGLRSVEKNFIPEMRNDLSWMIYCQSN